MSGAFDPYSAWLGIPAHEQPPNNYRLLGLNVLEADPTAIHEAAQRLLAQLNALGVGEYQPTASRLMAEVVAARDCLLTPPAKAAYDQQLLAAYGPPPTRTPPAFSPPEASPPWQAPQHSNPADEGRDYAHDAPYAQPLSPQPDDSQPQYSQPQYSQPQYSQQQYSQQQYSQQQSPQQDDSQPQYSQPQSPPQDYSQQQQYSQQQNPQPDYSQQQQYSQQQNPQPDYSQPQYSQYSQPDNSQPPYSQHSPPGDSHTPNRHGQLQPSPPVEPGAGPPRPETADGSASVNRPIPLGPANQADSAHAVSASQTSTTRRNRKRNRREKTPQEIAVEAAKIAGGGIAGLTVATLLLWFALGLDPLGIFSGGEQAPRNQTAETKRSPGPAERTGSNAVASQAGNRAAGVGAANPNATQQRPPDAMGDAAGAAGDAAPHGATTSVVDAANPSEGVGVIVANGDPGNTTPPTPQAPAQRPVPSGEEQAEKLALIREIFAERLTAGEKDPAQAAAFFLEQARSLDNDPASKFMLLKQAFQFAGATPDFDQGEAVISELIRHFEMDARLLKLFLVEQVAASARTEADRNRLMNEALGMSRQFQQLSQFDLADRMASIAEALALKLRDPGVRIAAKNILTENKVRRVADKRLALLAKSIAETPDDPDLNTKYGTVLCVQRQDWKQGIRHLAMGIPGALRDAAELDIAADADPGVSLKAAERWEEIGRSDDSLNVFHLRALRWYRQAATGASGLERIRLEKRIAAIESESGLKELAAGDNADPVDPKPAETSGPLVFAPRRRTELPATSDIGAAFSTRGTQIAIVGRTGRVATWSVADRTPLRTLGYPAVLGMPTRLAAAGDYVACGFGNGGVMVWNLEKGSVVNQFAAHDEAISALKFSQDGRVLLTTDVRRRVAGCRLPPTTSRKFRGWRERLLWPDLLERRPQHRRRSIAVDVLWKAGGHFSLGKPGRLRRLQQLPRHDGRHL